MKSKSWIGVFGISLLFAALSAACGSAGEPTDEQSSAQEKGGGGGTGGTAGGACTATSPHSTIYHGTYSSRAPGQMSCCVHEDDPTLMLCITCGVSGNSCADAVFHRDSGVIVVGNAP